MSSTRPKSLVAAIALLVLASLMVFLPLGGLIDLSEVPQAVIYAGYAMALLCFVAAWLLWSRSSRIGWWIAVVVCLLDGLSAAPGIVFAGDPGTRAIATTGTVLRLATVVLLVWPATRAAVFGASEKVAS